MLALSNTSSQHVECCPENRPEFSSCRACLMGESCPKLAQDMPDATIHTLGTILENLNPVLYRVALPNGKQILAHLSKPLTESKAAFHGAEIVLLELTPFDFDQARILGRAD